MLRPISNFKGLASFLTDTFGTIIPKTVITFIYDRLVEMLKSFLEWDIYSVALSKEKKRSRNINKYSFSVIAYKKSYMGKEVFNDSEECNEFGKQFKDKVIKKFDLKLFGLKIFFSFIEKTLEDSIIPIGYVINFDVNKKINS